MNWPLILTLTTGAISAAASYLSYKDKKKAAIAFTLTAAVISGISAFVQKKDYSEETPAITASSFGSFIHIIIVDVDKELPLKDVSAKMQGNPTINLGTLYPQSVYTIGDVEIPKKDMTYIVTVWYNETVSIEVDINVTVKPDSTVNIDTKYFDNKGIQFTPNWKIRASKSTGTANKHYTPTLFH